MTGVDVIVFLITLCALLLAYMRGVVTGRKGMQASYKEAMAGWERNEKLLYETIVLAQRAQDGWTKAMGIIAEHEETIENLDFELRNSNLGEEDDPR